jgi:hypothetical protein
MAATSSHGLCSREGVHKKFLLLFLASALVFDFTGCVSMSPQARRERAYRHYLAKQMKQRQKQMARAQKQADREIKRRMKHLQPSEPKITAGVENVQSEMPSVLEPVAQPSAPSSLSERVVPPVTVSASSEIMATQNPDQPSPP